MHALNTVDVIDSPDDMANSQTMVILLASGNDDGGMRATLAFTAATCAAAMDKRTIVFMVGDGAHWAYDGRAAGVQQQGFPPLGELMDCLLEMGGEMYVCSTCDGVCSVPSDDMAENLRRHPAITPRGMSAVLSDMIEGRAVTF
jgi:predicted peroxiredoxin